jgi:hypothetical protein
LLRHAFNIAREAERVASLPIFELHDPKDARKGFFEREQFEAVLRGPTGDLKPVVHVAYLTGWRLKSEVLTRRKQHLDLKDGWLRLRIFAR